MKNQLLLLGLVGVSVASTAPSSRAAIVLSENFEDPANAKYTLGPNTQFFQEPTRYFNRSSDIDPAALNPNLNPGNANATTYLTGQNMDIAPFSATAPGELDFTVNVTGLTDLRLSLDLAGLGSAEDVNYIRVFTDDDGDGVYDMPVLSFQGANNSPYIETTTGDQLTPTFQTFSNFVLNNPTAADGNLRVRLQLYNDTDSQNEATGVDNFVITGNVPEPSTIAVLGGALGMLGIARRRRG